MKEFREFRKLKRALLASEANNGRIIDTVVSIIRQSRQTEASTDEVLNRLYREILVPNGVDADNTVF